jgi:hypothetical protein
MVNFTLIPSRYPEVIAHLKARVPDFERSDEYMADRGEADDLPGVILASLGKYVLGLSRRPDAHDQVGAALGAVADMLGWDDAEVTASVRDEFYEALEADGSVSSGILTAMPAALRRSFDDWASS